MSDNNNCFKTLPQQVEDNRKNIDLKQDKTDQTLINPSKDVVTSINDNDILSKSNKVAIQSLEGSIEVKSYLRTEAVGQTNINVVNTRFTVNSIFTIKTNPEIIDFDNLTNEYSIIAGVHEVDLFIPIPQTPSGTNNILQIILRNIGTATDDFILESELPNNVTDHNIVLYDVANLVADGTYLLQVECTAVVVLDPIRTIIINSQTNELFDNNIQLSQPSQTSITGTAISIFDNLKEFKDYLQDSTPLINAPIAVVGGETIIFNESFNNFDIIEFVLRNEGYPKIYTRISVDNLRIAGTGTDQGVRDLVFLKLNGTLQNNRTELLVDSRSKTVTIDSSTFNDPLENDMNILEINGINRNN